MAEVYLGGNKRNYECNFTLGAHDDFFLEVLKHIVAKCFFIQNIRVVS
jgi:hypothetical protein